MAKGKRQQHTRSTAASGNRFAPGTTSGTDTRGMTGARPAAGAKGATRPGVANAASAANAASGARAVTSMRSPSRLQMRAPLGRSAARRQQRLPWWRQSQAITVFATVAGLAVLVGILILVARAQSPSAGPTGPASASLVRAVTGVSQQVSNTVGTGGVTDPLQALPTQAVLTGPTGKPEVLYIGAEYCPFCAAERWSVIVALSRFGTFGNLHTTTSSSTDIYPDTPTFTFYGSTYQSQYLDFVPVETTTRDSTVPLQSPTSAQRALLAKYDAPPYSSQAGSIPFLDFGNQYVILSAGYSPQLLAGYTPDQVGATLTDTNNAIAKGIIGNANEMTAALCTLTKNQPGAVCTASAIQQIEARLPKGK